MRRRMWLPGSMVDSQAADSPVVSVRKGHLVIARPVLRRRASVVLQAEGSLPGDRVVAGRSTAAHLMEECPAAAHLMEAQADTRRVASLAVVDLAVDRAAVVDLAVADLATADAGSLARQRPQA